MTYTPIMVFTLIHNIHINVHVHVKIYIYTLRQYNLLEVNKKHNLFENKICVSLSFMNLNFETQIFFFCLKV